MRASLRFHVVFGVVGLLASACGGLQVQLHKTAVQKPSNVALYFSVETSDGLPVPSLPVEAFRIYEDDQLISPYESKQTILNPEVAVVHYTLLLLDLSGSVTESGSIPTLQAAASAFSERVTRFHRVGVAGFDGRAKLISLVPFTSQPSAVRSGLAGLERFKPQDPSTNLNGAIVEALTQLDKQLDAAEQPLKFATLVIFTDGSDRAHRVPEQVMLEKIEQARANVFVIAVGGEIAESQLERIAVTGFVKTDQLANVGTAFDEVAALIEASARKFYLLSYCSPARAGEHALKVEVVGAGSSGTASYGFDAKGFGPGCDPTRTPNFSKTKVRLPST